MPKDAASLYLDLLKYTFTKPTKLFSFLSTKNSGKHTIIYFTLVSLFSTVIGLGINWSWGGYYFFYGGILYFFILLLIVGTMYCAIVLGIAKAFKGKASYKETFCSFLLSSIPFVLFLPTGIPGILALFYSLYLFVVGISHVHKIKIAESSMATLLPLIAFLGLCAIYLYFLFSSW